ncbi:MAG: ribonuclease Z, partial [Bacteroidota bacterium]|nr:ribonuclease Z [Bacteroidota bacterium]
MTSLLHPQLVNDVFGDPGVYAEFMFERRAFLFDLGDVRCLAPRKLMKVSDVFISHTHADHFSGFDQLLRLFLGREKTVTLHGPAGLIDRVGH